MKTVTKKKGLLAQKGFTLIELLIVIVIIGILAGILIAVIDPRTQQNRARDANVRSSMNKLALHVGAYVSAYGEIPDDIEFQEGLQNFAVAGTYTAAASDAELTFNLTNSLLAETCAAGNTWQGDGLVQCNFYYCGGSDESAGGPADAVWHDCCPETSVGCDGSGDPEVAFRIYAKSWGDDKVFMFDSSDSRMWSCDNAGINCEVPQ